MKLRLVVFGVLLGAIGCSESTPPVMDTLTVVRAGGGTGTVTSAPAGIDCNTDCTESYTRGSMVTLTATAASGSTFIGWAGGCTGTGTCVVTLSAATTVTATFALLVYTTNSGWTCGSGVSCQDVYDITVPAGTKVTVAVTAVTGSSVLRLAAFGPGTDLDGKNLMTGLTLDRQCVGQNASDTPIIRAVTAGRYRIAVGRDYGSSSGLAGTYTLTITADQAMEVQVSNVNDAASRLAGAVCGYTSSASASWACASTVSCQDVYDFETLASTTVTVSVTSVTGNSVVRLAAFDGSAVNTTNRFNAGLTDRKCVGQDTNDAATTGVLPLGQHRFAVGRDWGSSSGSSGTYTVTITTPNAPLAEGGATLNDTPSAFATTTCP